MDPTHDPSPGQQAPAPPGGELVVQNGRLSGTRRPLGLPLTFLGRAASCDVRLNVDGISSLHCLIAHTPNGVVLRDLDSEHGTFVNSARVSTSPLRDGDLLAVGPFQLRVHLPPALPENANGRPSGAEDPDRAEKEALRIQAAAVAAQQAALTEEEARLQQRRTALEQQESQLAAHLDDKRRRLLQIAEHAQTARTALQQEREAYENHVQCVTSDLTSAQREILEAQQKAQKERQRLVNLRRRLKQRYHRHWLAERQTMSQREDELVARGRQLEKDAKRLQQDRDALTQARLRFNGETELARRQLQDERETLRRQQKEYAEQRGRAQAQRKEQERALAQREEILADGERLLDDEKYRWEKACGYLKKETAGLETRIHNQRRKIVEQQQEIDTLETRLRDLQTAAPAVAEMVAGTQDPASAAPSSSQTTLEQLPADAAGKETIIPPESILSLPTAQNATAVPPSAPDAASAVPATASVAPEATPVVAAELVPVTVLEIATPAPLVPKEPSRSEADNAHAAREAQLCEAETALQRRAGLLLRLADELADQRRHMVEQWERLTLTHHSWHQERLAAAATLEALVASWPAREDALTARVHRLEVAEKDLRRRHQDAIHLRQHIEAWAARVRLREASWESERDRLLTDLRGREALAEKHLGALVELRQRWTKRRRQELDVVRAERAACETLRQECNTLREELWRRGNALEEDRRLLAEKALAMEQYRQQYVIRAADAAAAERRVERLRRRWVTQNANLLRTTAAERQALQEEIARLQDRHTALHKQMEALTVREANLAQRQIAWEESQALTEVRQAKLQQALQSMQAQRDRHALHLLELQDEVERIARVLLEEPELPLAISSQAA